MPMFHKGAAMLDKLKILKVQPIWNQRYTVKPVLSDHIKQELSALLSFSNKQPPVDIKDFHVT